MAGSKRGERRKVGYAVIGLGHIAQAAVLPAFEHARENSRLAALVSGDSNKRKALGKRYDVPAFRYEELDEVLARDDVDAIYIALPNTEHADCAVRAARAGVHVLTEKPMATSEEDCRRMIAAAEESGVKLMVAYRLHFEPANMEAVELVRSGRIVDERTTVKKYPASDQFAPELLELSQCILDDRDPEPDGWEGLADVRIIEAALRSVRERRPVRVEPIERRRRPGAAQVRRRPPVKEPEPVRAEAPDR